MKKYIYADNAATTEIDTDAFEAMKPFLLQEYGNPSQPYSFARKPKKTIEEARQIIASCIGAQTDEIYFTSGGTESDNWVIKGNIFEEEKDKCIITSKIEHHAILHACSSVEKMGYPVIYMAPDSKGYIKTDTLKSTINHKTKLVSVMLANNEIGTIQPIKELCTEAHKYNALFHTDAVQAVGHINIDVNELGIDFLSASAHKFNGTKGTGFLYIRKGSSILPFTDGGSQEFGLRGGTENVAGIICMATALKKNCSQLEENQNHIRKMENELLSTLTSSGLKFNKNGGDNSLPGLLSLSFAGYDGEAILHRMDLMGIAISTGSACNSKNTEISHVLQAIKLDESLAKGTIRISLGKNNTEEDVKIIATALLKIINHL